MGEGDNKFTVGGETVLFRHEKTFVNKTGLGVLITDAMAEADVAERINKFNSLRYEWIGLILRAEMIAIKNVSGDAAKFAALVKRVVDQTDAIPVLMSDSVDALKAALAVSATRRPIIYAATEQNFEALAGLAKEFKCPLAAKSDNLNSLSELTDKIVAADVKDIVLDSGARTVRKVFEDMIFLRRAALTQKNRSLGFSPIVFPGEKTNDPLKESVIAAMLIAKYAGIVVMSDLQGDILFPLLLERLMPEQRVLEVGTGTGLLTEKLAVSSSMVVSIDPYRDAPSHRAIAQEGLRKHANIRLVQGDILSFQDSPFDVVVSRFTYHHIPQKLEFLRRCHELLRGGGTIIIADEFLPEKPTREEAVNMFHIYRKQLADAGIMPPEEGIWEQDLARQGEYKTTIQECLMHLRQSGFSDMRQALITSDLDIDHQLLGYAVLEATKERES